MPNPSIPHPIDKSLLGYCGIYCGACFMRKADKTHNYKLIPPRWRPAASKHQSLYCEGCQGTIRYGGCADCSIHLCAQSEKLDHCFQCTEFPCEDMTALKNNHLPHHLVAQIDFPQIDTMGITSWLKFQESRWTCPSCGTPFSWYEENCEKCGAELLNSQKECTQRSIR